ISKSKASLSLSGSHALLEENVVIDARRGYFFVLPSLKHRHGDIFHAPTEACFRSDVITHARWNSGEMHDWSVVRCQLLVFGLWPLRAKNPPTRYLAAGSTNRCL